MISCPVLINVNPMSLPETMCEYGRLTVATYHHAVKDVLTNVRNLLEFLCTVHVLSVYQLHLLDKCALTRLTRAYKGEHEILTVLTG